MHTNNGRIVLNSLADLAQFRGLVVSQETETLDPAPAPTDPLPVSPTPPRDGVDVDGLAATLAGAMREFAALAQADALARQQAGADLDAYRRLEDTAHRLERVVTDAEDAARQAENLMTAALDRDCRGGAEQVRTVALTVASTARDRMTATRVEVDRLSARPHVQRLLEEGRRAAQVAERAAEERRKEERLQRGLEDAQALLAEGKENEARRLLGDLAKEHPNSPELASVTDTLDRRARAVKSAAAERALRQARSLARRAPADALALLGSLDLDSVPDTLARQVYGCWLAACRRVAGEDAHHYSPRFGHGAVLLPTEDGRLEVVAAIGLPEWTSGRRFARAALRGARPL